MKKNIVSFNFITDHKIIFEIIKAKLTKIKDNLFKDKNINLIYKDIFIENLTEIIIEKFDKNYGGRGIVTELETIFIDELSNFIFNHYDKWQEMKKIGNLLNIEISIIDEKVNFILK